ncbi:MAG TPA: Gfo/Idh/MocA family oxidoreductase [Ilumatobacteraceae bacterium]|nr:Gfo/Idh/MocA family oxidoreductase [Ilumatobacteraceae bacterium]
MTTPSDPVGFGVIGAGSMVATRAVMPAIDASEGGHLVAVSSRSGATPAPWTHLDVGSYESVIAHPGVDVVYIALPNSLHEEWVERATAAGRHVLCEKPIATTADAARRMAAGAARAGVVLAEAWMTPFDARWRSVMQMVADGDIGRPIDIDSSFTFTISPAASDNYRWSPQLGGGALLDVGIYCLGPVIQLWGAEPDLIEATSLWDRSGVDARTEATLEWGDGRRARLRCSFVDVEEQRIEIIGTDAAVVLESDAHTGGARADTIVVAGADGTLRRVRVSPTDPYLGMVDAFIAAVRNGREFARPMSASIELLTLIERIEQAAQ